MPAGPARPRGCTGRPHPSACPGLPATAAPATPPARPARPAAPARARAGLSTVGTRSIRPALQIVRARLAASGPGPAREPACRPVGQTGGAGEPAPMAPFLRYLAEEGKGGRREAGLALPTPSRSGLMSLRSQCRSGPAAGGREPSSESPPICRGNLAAWPETRPLPFQPRFGPGRSGRRRKEARVGVGDMSSSFEPSGIGHPATCPSAAKFSQMTDRLNTPAPNLRQRKRCHRHHGFPGPHGVDQARPPADRRPSSMGPSEPP